MNFLNKYGACKTIVFKIHNDYLQKQRTENCIKEIKIQTMKIPDEKIL